MLKQSHPDWSKKAIMGQFSIFDVDDEDGQREHTTVKLIREDIEDLI